MAKKSRLRRPTSNKGVKKQAVAPQARDATPWAPGGAAEASRGLAAFQQGRYDEAIRVWQPATRSSDAPAALRDAMAEAHFRRALGPVQSARRMADLQQAIALCPTHAMFHFHLALTCQREDQMRRALAAYEEAHRLAPADERIARHFALALLGSGDPTASVRARALLTTARAGDEATARLRALSHLLEGEPSAALEVMAEVRQARVRRSATGAPRLTLLGTLTRSLAQLATNQPDEALATLASLRASSSRSDTGATSEATTSILPGAVMLATLATSLRRGDPDAAHATLMAQQIPADPGLRRVAAHLCRQLVVELQLDERTESAAEVLDRTLEAAPGHEATRVAAAHVHEVAGVAAARRGDHAAAARHWQLALRHGAGHPRLLRNLALAAECSEQWPEAAAHWEELIRHWRKELQSVRQGAGAKGHGSGPAKATRRSVAGPERSPAARATELRHWLAIAYRHQAAALEADGNIPEALRTMERGLNFDPSNVELRRRVANWYLDYEEYGPAVAHLRRVVAARPQDTDALLELGSALDLQGKDDESQSYLEQALVLEPQNQAVRDTLASVHHKLGGKLAARGANAEALAAFSRAIELAPRQDRHHFGLGAHYLTLGRVEDAEAAFAQALARAPRDPSLRVLIGLAYLDNGRAKEADRFLREALRLGGGSPYLYALVGQLYARHGQPARAEACFARVLKSRDPKALFRIGDALMNQDRFEDALPYLERAVALDPFDGGAHLALAFALARGRADYERAAFELGAAKVAAEAFGDRELLADIALARTLIADMVDTARATS